MKFRQTLNKVRNLKWKKRRLVKIVAFIVIPLIFGKPKISHALDFSQEDISEVITVLSILHWCFPDKFASCTPEFKQMAVVMCIRAVRTYTGV